MNSSLEHSKFHNAAERGRIFTTGYKSALCEIVPVIIIREVWDLCTSGKVSRFASKEERESLPEGQYYIEYNLAAATEEGIAHIENQKAQRKRKKKENSWEDY